MLKKLSIIFLMILIGCTSSSENITPEENTNKEKTQTISTNSKNNIQVFEETEGILGDSTPITRALVGKMLSLTFNINSVQQESIKNYIDLDASSWYYPYVINAINNNLIVGDGKNFRPNDYLSIEEADYLAKKFNPNYKTQLEVTNENKNTPISYGLWIEIYKDILANTSNEVKTKSTIILNTNKNNNLLNEFSFIGDSGLYNADGILIDNYIDQELSFYYINNEICGFIQIKNTTPILEKAYIISNNSNDITVFVGGTTRKYSIKNGPKENLSGFICDLQIKNGVSTNIQVFTKNIQDKILLINQKENIIELKNNGTIKIDETAKIYGNFNGITYKNINDLHSGNENIIFYLQDNKVTAAIITTENKAEKIRVVLNDSSFNNLYHDELIVYGDIEITSKNFSKEFTGETNIKDALGKDLQDNKRFFINYSNPIEIKSIKRNNGYTPKYRGLIEFTYSNNKFVLVNELSMDQYLYAVIPSEMPSTYGVETSKVQAITARSYAYNQLFASRYDEYGGNVNDSVSSQVYNNIPENETSIESVDSTSGFVITYNKEIINANFYSTSGGTSGSSNQVWLDSTGNLDRSSPEYLSYKRFFNNSTIGDLSVEDTADEFFKKNNFNAPDSENPWFRWTVTMTAEEISTSINNNITERYNATPHLIQTKIDDNYISQPISSIGLIKDINVIQRGMGGNILAIEIIGTDKTVKILGEYNIRSLLKPYQYNSNGKNIVLKRLDNSTVENYSILPSSFFTMDKAFDDNNSLNQITFFGGGNGHGVGLSQNGAHNLILEGMSVEEVIQYYYTNCKVINPFS